MSTNHVSISGNLVRHTLRMTASGIPVMNFTVAVDDRRRNKDGEWEDYANFVDCTMFGKRAEAVEPLFATGAKLSIDGKLHMSSWLQDDVRRTKLEVYVDDIEVMSPRNGDAS